MRRENEEREEEKEGDSEMRRENEEREKEKEGDSEMRRENEEEEKEEGEEEQQKPEETIIRSKGILKHHRDLFVHLDFDSALHCGQEVTSSQGNIRNIEGQVSSTVTFKRVFSAVDDKRFHLSAFESLAYGHPDIPLYQERGEEEEEREEQDVREEQPVEVQDVGEEQEEREEQPMEVQDVGEEQEEREEQAVEEQDVREEEVQDVREEEVQDEGEEPDIIYLGSFPKVREEKLIEVPKEEETKKKYELSEEMKDLIMAKRDQAMRIREEKKRKREMYEEMKDSIMVKRNQAMKLREEKKRQREEEIMKDSIVAKRNQAMKLREEKKRQREEEEIKKRMEEDRNREERRESESNGGQPALEEVPLPGCSTWTEEQVMKRRRTQENRTPVCRTNLWINRKNDDIFRK